MWAKFMNMTKKEALYIPQSPVEDGSQSETILAWLNEQILSFPLMFEGNQNILKSAEYWRTLNLEDSSNKYILSSIWMESLAH